VPVLASAASVATGDKVAAQELSWGPPTARSERPRKKPTMTRFAELLGARRGGIQILSRTSIEPGLPAGRDATSTPARAYPTAC
jgi:hypothetical protein